MPDDAEELSQAEIEALLAQASELGAGKTQENEAENPAQASGTSVFEADAASVEPANLEGSKPRDRIMSEDEALDVLGDVPIDISIELGRVKLSIGELIELRSGAVLALDRLVGEPVDILANGTLIARGEVVVLNDYYSVRVAEIVNEGD